MRQQYSTTVSLGGCTWFWQRTAIAAGAPGLSHSAAAADLLGDVLSQRQGACACRHRPVAESLLIRHSLVRWEEKLMRPSFFQFKKKENGHRFKRDSSAKNPKYIFIVLFIHLDRFGVSCRLLEIGCGDICLLSNIMEVDGTRLVVLAAMSLSRNHDPVTQNYHRPCCEQFHVGTAVFLLNCFTAHEKACTVSTVTAWDVNINGARVGLMNDAIIHRRWLTAY